MTNRKRKRAWTEKEEQRLIYLCERYPQCEVARKLKRTISSVKAKRLRMNLDSFSDSTDKLNIAQISELVGVHRQSITRTWFKYGFKTEKEGMFLLAAENELIRFMKKHPELWKAADCDYYFFQRFDWFIDKLHKEKAGQIQLNQYRTRKSWTELEISRFKMLKKRGLTNSEIAKELDRTLSSVEHMSARLRRQYEEEKTFNTGGDKSAM